MKESIYLICNPMKDFVTTPLEHLNFLTNDICKWFQPKSNLTGEEKCKIIMDIVIFYTQSQLSKNNNG